MEINAGELFINIICNILRNNKITTIKPNTIYKEDCLEGMKRIQDKSIDMIFCDLPYGTTSCSWDTVIPFKPLWEQYERIIKDNGAIVLSASQPFTTELINSNRKLFRYELIWEKSSPSGFLNARKMPLKIHENVLLFYKKPPVYNPQKYIVPERLADKRISKQKYGNADKTKTFKITGPKSELYSRKASGVERFPDSILCFTSHWSKGMHPTQKPLPLVEWLVQTYSNEGDIILDNCMGGGTTAIACINTKRNYIGFENSNEYFKMTMDRIKNHLDVN